MAKIIFICLLLTVNQLVAQNTAQSNNADMILGTWLTDTKDSKIEIYKSGDHYFGKLIWANEMFEADGKTSKKDTHNPDQGLQSRALQNLVILTNFVYDDETWDNGKIYDPESGKTYSCVMKLKDGKLHIRGYVGFSMFGRTVVWERVK
jgi:uncharacterized protein (DUF2147 family)